MSGSVEAGAAPDPSVAATVDVTVAGNFQVSHDGNVYGPGETLTVPRELADTWTLNGWVTAG